MSALPGTAVAEVRLAFSPEPVYSRFQAIFDLIEKTNDAPALAAGYVQDIRQRPQGMARASFRRFDDGWRLEQIQKQ